MSRLKNGIRSLPRDFPRWLRNLVLRDVCTEEGIQLDDRSHLFGATDTVISEFLLQHLRNDCAESEVRHYAVQRLLSGIISKYADPAPEKAEERDQAAYDKFRKTEQSLAAVNQRLRKYTPIWAEHARAFIKKVIGVHVPRSVFDTARHGPGSAVGPSRKGQFPKWKPPYAVTAPAWNHLLSVMLDDERWRDSLLNGDFRHLYSNHVIDTPHDLACFARIVSHNRITTVPKSDVINRTIAIEPVGNVFLQLGVDGFIRRKLRNRVGIDLNDQTANQRLAIEGSQSDLATLDLSSASDSVSLRLCKVLLPSDWYYLLTSLRCPYGLLEGRSVRYRKISSMGNGYTFALESLVFASLAYAAGRISGYYWGEYKCGIYGDDIIVPREIALVLIPILQEAGFQLNSKKSFLWGDFKESCGVDAYKGVIVTPVYARRPPQNVVELMALHNQLFGWSCEVYGRMVFHETCAALRALAAPEQLRSNLKPKDLLGPPIWDSTSAWFFHPYPVRFRDAHGTYRQLAVSLVRLNGYTPDMWIARLLNPLRQKPGEYRKSVYTVDEGSDPYITYERTSVGCKVTRYLTTEWPETCPRPVGMTHRDNTLWARIQRRREAPRGPGG